MNIVKITYPEMPKEVRKAAMKVKAQIEERNKKANEFYRNSSTIDLKKIELKNLSIFEELKEACDNYQYKFENEDGW